MGSSVEGPGIVLTAQRRRNGCEFANVRRIFIIFDRGGPEDTVCNFRFVAFPPPKTLPQFARNELLAPPPSTSVPIIEDNSALTSRTSPCLFFCFRQGRSSF